MVRAMSDRKRPPLTLPEAAPIPVPEDLTARAAALGVELTPALTASLARYLGLLLAMNEQMNLTALTNHEEIWPRHILDALTLEPLLRELPEGSAVADVGSGGGLPALPLALALPKLRFTLVESTQKKALFLSDAAKALGLTNVRVRAERAEAVARDPERFAAVTARAVGRIAVLAPLVGPLLAPGGRALLLKGQRAREELDEAAKELTRAKLQHERTVETPTGRIVVLQKASPKAK